MFTMVPATADQKMDPAELEKKLQELESEISKFKDMLDRTHGEKSNLESNLESNEKSINELLKKIQTIESDLSRGEDKIGRLLDKQKELQRAKSEQQQYIANQIRAAYKIGDQEYLKILLNQEDPNQISRMLTYYDYFNRARAEQIEAYSKTIMQLQNVAGLIDEENQILVKNRSRLQRQRSGLLSVQKEKRKILIALTKEISTTGKEIEKLVADRQQLELLIQRIQDGVANLSTPAVAVPFESLKGQLLLPVAGKITHRFGNRRNAGKLRWTGVFINAPEGDPVYAVHYGRVVFSDWLRGFGLIMIISHGEGYMSLYGHNQVLYRVTGDWVTAGETIATVGNSGGQKNPGLYFEIRVAGKTADPQSWCMARSKRAA
jgi:septal ring factor EnvC (AmiA/AmiB activator)|tara:strand:+ start:1368 stop:2498 length:1131 start_codon:yes stop_codon:yes gene_type:complete